MSICQIRGSHEDVKYKSRFLDIRILKFYEKYFIFFYLFVNKYFIVMPEVSLKDTVITSLSGKRSIDIVLFTGIRII